MTWLKIFMWERKGFRRVRVCIAILQYVFTEGHGSFLLLLGINQNSSHIPQFAEAPNTKTPTRIPRITILVLMLRLILVVILILILILITNININISRNSF